MEVLLMWVQLGKRLLFGSKRSLFFTLSVHELLNHQQSPLILHIIWHCHHGCTVPVSFPNTIRSISLRLSCLMPLKPI